MSDESRTSQDEGGTTKDTKDTKTNKRKRGYPQISQIFTD